MEQHLTAIIEREGEGYVALCPGYDIASQGYTIEEARQNLMEAIELFMECASPEELACRGGGAVDDVPVGFTLRIFDPLGKMSE
jgi:predicted RNase H-like HicB family nuclease